ncbi:MAG: LarC family nickel insertion protein [Thermodesulfobacteriota bacterium]
MPALHLDAAFGLGGDMFLAALADVGYDPAPLQEALRAAGIAADLSCPRTVRHGLAGRRLDISFPQEQPLRHLEDLLRLLAAMPLPARVLERSAAAFRRLAEVEAAVHGIGVEQVHFHEVGAADTLADVAGAFHALHCLGLDRVTCSPLPWFRGTVRCAHGVLPLPAPATRELLKGKPVFPTEFTREIITPTGALILDQCVDAFANGPEGIILATGAGFGTLDLGAEGQGLRAVLYDPTRVP